MVKLAFVLLTSVLVCFAQTTNSAARPKPVVPPVKTNQAMVLTTAEVAKRVSPSVVVIHGKTDSGDVLGSGFVISMDGKIVTNFHVIKDLNTAAVQLTNGDLFDSVSVLATDERRDIAILKIAGFNLPALELGDSDSLMVGEPLVIVGSPKGLDGTVTAGILSSVRDSGEGFRVLQTDAAVNPGNSGGPLVNAKGQAIGIVSFKLRSAESLNFAIPINYLRGILNNLHEPMTLSQMRKQLVGMASTNSQSDGPTLKETLDWLNEKIPLAADHYVQTLSMFFGPKIWPGGSKTKEVILKTIPLRFDTCTVVYEMTETWVWEKFPDHPQVTATRFTVPLGAIVGGEISKGDISGVTPKKLTWTIILVTVPKVVLEENRKDLTKSTKSEHTGTAFIMFYDESLAERVKNAFMHAAGECRKQKDPF